MPAPGTNTGNGLILSHNPDDFKIDEELRDIKGFFGIEVPVWVWYLLAVIALAVLGWFLYRYFKNRNQEKELSLVELTIKRLNELDLGLSSKVFYLRYSELIKNYIEVKLNLHVLDKTADEMRDLLHTEERLETSQVLSLSHIFSRADLAKFARQEVSKEQRQSDVTKAKEIINAIETRLTLAQNPNPVDQFSDLNFEAKS